MQLNVDYTNKNAPRAERIVHEMMNYNKSLFGNIDAIFLQNGVKESFINKLLRLNTEGYYWNNYKGHSIITINLKSIYRHYRINDFALLFRTTTKIVMMILLTFFLLLCFPFIFVMIAKQIIKDKTLRFYYLIIYRKIPREIREKETDKYKLRLLNYLFFFLGLHKHFNVWCRNNDTFNINLYRDAYNFKIRNLRAIYRE